MTRCCPFDCCAALRCDHNEGTAAVLGTFHALHQAPRLHASHVVGDSAAFHEGAATDPFGNLRVGFEGSAVINRKDYGITWNAALETGGVLVSDKITLEFEVSAIKAA